ncbi:Abi-alpha family protein [Lactiplantibacillus plantarum]|uniref:Abi-alpha family protein n=1 Tax=Lactiplantibacillus plantarum TaxID=1590 RepID=UPI000978BF50|nr:Abi-alpha family protein [Lactiplantibacillus plantarum]
MPMDPNSVEAILNALPNSTQELLFNPSADAVGKGIGGIMLWLFQKPIRLGIIKKKEFTDFANKCAKDLQETPVEKRTDSKKGLMIKTLESAQYAIDSETLQNCFAYLLGQTANKDTVREVLPVFSTILSNMTTEDALFLKKFSEQGTITLPVAKFEAHVTHISSSEDESQEKNTSRQLTRETLIEKKNKKNEFILSNPNKQFSFFQSFGILELLETEYLVADAPAYEYYEKTTGPKAQEIFEKTIRDGDAVMYSIRLVAGNVKLTELGVSFINCIIP